MTILSYLTAIQTWTNIFLTHKYSTRLAKTEISFNVMFWCPRWTEVTFDPRSERSVVPGQQQNTERTAFRPHSPPAAYKINSPTALIVLWYTEGCFFCRIGKIQRFMCLKREKSLFPKEKNTICLGFFLWVVWPFCINTIEEKAELSPRMPELFRNLILWKLSGFWNAIHLTKYLSKW